MYRRNFLSTRWNPEEGVTIGVLSHTEIQARLTGLKEIGIDLTAEEILKMPPKKRPEDLKFSRQQGAIIVDPPYTKEDLDPKGKDLLGTVSLDLELGGRLCIHANPHSIPVNRNGILEDPIVDLTLPESIRYIEDRDTIYDLKPGEKYVLAPGLLVKGYTLRHFFLPYDLMGLVVGKSKVGRFGVTTTVDAPKIDPGFGGRIVLELAHLGAYRFALSEGLAIAQMIFLSV
jgi:deoxycytidine triphosphate deaminase